MRPKSCGRNFIWECTIKANVKVNIAFHYNYRPKTPIKFNNIIITPIRSFDLMLLSGTIHFPMERNTIYIKFMNLNNHRGTFSKGLR